MLVYGSILESHKAREIAYDLLVSEEQAAAMWFIQTFDLDLGFNEENIAYKRYIYDIEEIGCSLYLDWYADYYFLVKKQ